MSKTFTEKTNAINKSIGFDFQYYYFLDAILNIKSGQSVGLEVKDDIHTELDSDRQILIQLKHTTQKTAGGAPIALSDLDIDLWKTIFNWAKITSDDSDGRREQDKQLAFVSKTIFLLASNKSENGGNTFIKQLSAYQNDDVKFQDIKTMLNSFHAKTDNKKIKEYLSFILGLNEEILKKFFLNIKFELNENDIIRRVKNSILTKVISDRRVDEVFERLDSNLRQDNFLATKAGQSVIVSFLDFNSKYSKIFDDARSKKLTRHEFSFVAPLNLNSQTFILQLVEIGDFSADDIDLVIRYTTDKVMLENHLIKWVADGLLTSDNVHQMYDETKSIWHNRFRQAYRFAASLNASERRIKALEMIDELRCCALSVDMNTLDTRFSNGVFYYLSDLPAIGWDHEWDKKFK